MLPAETTPRRANELDFLKSIVECDPSDTSQKNDPASELSPSPSPFAFTSSLRQPHLRPKSSRGHRGETETERPQSCKHRAEIRQEVGGGRQEQAAGGHEARLSRTEMWARGELDDSRVEDGRRRQQQRRAAPPCSSARPPPAARSRPRSGKAAAAGATVAPHAAGAGTVAAYRAVVDPVACRLERKYMELRELLQGPHPEDGLPKPHSDLIRLATKMTRRYHAEAQGLTAGAVTSSRNAAHLSSPRSHDLNWDAQRDRDDIMYSPRSDRGEYILIDGTGSVVKTTKVRRGRPRLTPSRRKKQAVPNAWGSKSNSQVSLEKTPSHKASTRSGTLSRSPSPGKKDGKKGTDYYSDSFSSDSSLSRSRSHSRSKQKTCELHLKYTKNEKLLAWLKSKDQIERMHKRQQRKERREKRKAEELKLEEVETLKEKSKQKVDEWMKMKKKEARLLRREQRTSFLDQKSTIDELVVIDEMLDLREHGARIDPSLVPEGLKVIIERPESEKRAEESVKCESVGHAPKRPSSCRPSSSQATVRVRGRPQSAVNLLFGRPVSGKKGRFSEGAKEKVRLHKEKVLKEQEVEQKRRKAYNDWLKSKRNSKTLKSPQDPNTKSKVTPKEVVTHEHSSAAQKTAVEVKAEHSSPVNHLADKDKGKHIIRGADSKSRPKTSKERVRITKQPTIPAPPPQTEAEVVKSGESSGTPRPKIKKGEAYNAVKQDQKSWENFADHVWKQTNEEEHHVENEAQCRPEPQGSDMPDKGKALSTNSDDITATAAESVPQLSDISQDAGNNERHTPVTEVEEQASHPEVESRNTDTRINDDNQQPNEALDTKGKPSLAAEPTVEIGASVDSITGRSRSSRSSSQSELEVTGGSAFITAPE